MLNSPCHRRRPLHFWNKLLAIAALVGALFGVLSAHAAPAHAAPSHSPAATRTPAFPSIDQFKGNAASYHPTAKEAAIAADKARLSAEYVHRVLTGKEPLSTFETHYRAFMVKWHLGGVANLHRTLTQGLARLRSGRPIAPMCISTARAPQVLCPVYQAQFPEENWNWCGPATLSTTLIEDSFAWPGTNQYNGETLTRDQYYVSQPYHPAYDDEYWLATHGVISGDIWNNGTSVNQMNTVVNDFVNGKGGWYAQEWLSGSLSSQIADFQGKVSSDIGTGWDVPNGILIGAGNFYSMPGYPYSHAEIDHYVAVTYISSDGNTTYYSDPVYGAPAYSGWSVPPPYESTSTSNIVYWTQVIIW
jgi:hypothetical protein